MHFTAPPGGPIKPAIQLNWGLGRVAVGGGLGRVVALYQIISGYERANGIMPPGAAPALQQWGPEVGEVVVCSHLRSALQTGLRRFGSVFSDIFSQVFFSDFRIWRRVCRLIRSSRHWMASVNRRW